MSLPLRKRPWHAEAKKSQCRHTSLFASRDRALRSALYKVSEVLESIEDCC